MCQMHVSPRLGLAVAKVVQNSETTKSFARKLHVSRKKVWPDGSLTVRLRFCGC
jgi:hypothetical protein